MEDMIQNRGLRHRNKKINKFAKEKKLGAERNKVLSNGENPVQLVSKFKFTLAVKNTN